MAVDSSQYNKIVRKAISKNNVLVTHSYMLLHVNKATHLARFYLDDVAIAVDRFGVKGLLGICRVGSFNYNMHAANRRGCLAFGLSGGAGISFQDGGAHTKGYADQLTVLNQNVGTVMFSVFFKSAYYLDSTSIAIEINTYPYPSGWQSIPIGGAPLANSQGYYSPTRASIDAVIPKGGRAYTLRAIITNSELPPYIHNMDGFMFVQYRKVTAKFDESSAYYAYHTGSPLPVFLEAAIMNVGDKISFYADGTSSVDIQPGWYYFEGYCYRTDVNQIVQEKIWADGILPPGPPAPPQVVCNGYSPFTAQEAIDQWFNDPQFNVLYISRNPPATDVYFLNWTPSGGVSGEPPEGWYAISAEGDTSYYKAIYLIGGVVAATA